VKGIDLDRQQLKEIKTKVWKKVEQIESCLEWQDAKGLIPLLENLEGKLEGIENMADQGN
jgi:hypothetical protein